MLSFKLYGNLTRDPEIVHIDALNREVMKIRVAGKNPGSERTNYFSVTLWPPKDQPTISDELRGWTRGDRVEVSGTANSWESGDGDDYQTGYQLNASRFRNTTREPASKDCASHEHCRNHTTEATR